METAHQASFKNIIRLENVPYILLSLVLFLSPIIAISSAGLTFHSAKVILVSAGVIFSLMSLLVLTIKKGAVSFPKSIMLATLGVLVAVYLVSGLFSEVPSSSLFGKSFEIGTFSSVLLMAVLTYLVSVTFKERARLGTAYFVFFAAAGVLGLFHVLRLVFGADFLSFGVFTNVISNTIGKWNEVGVFFALTTVLAVLALEIVKMRPFARTLMYCLLAVSLFVLLTVNFPTLWYVLGATIAFLSIQLSVSNRHGRMTVSSEETPTTPTRRKIAYKPLIVLVVIIIFLLPIGRDFTKSMTAKLGVDDIEVRPSWSASYEIFKATMQSDPVFGVGPNRFANAWQLNRPDVNTSPFWNTYFNNAIGFIPTAFVETGILGLLSWIAFIISILYTGYRALAVRMTSELTRYFVASSFFATLFLWVMHIVYVPSLVMWVITFFFTGLFLASAVLTGAISMQTLSFGKSQATSFVGSSVAVVGLVLTVGLGYVFTSQAMAQMHLQRAVTGISRGLGVADVSASLGRSASLSENDLVYRALAEVNLIQINNLLNSVAGRTETTEAERAQFQSLLEAAILSGRRAVEADPTNFENHSTVGNVYSAIVPIGLEGSYDAAKKSYTDAIALSPRNPALYLSFARLELAKGDLTAAETHLARALELKPNYVDAIFIQSQVSVSKGDLQKAMTSAEQIVTLYPNDPLGYFRLGLLKYELKDFRTAAQIFEQSISLAPVYANAKYFLGLSYSKINRTADAILMFEDLQASNPDNAEVSLILSNLRAGREPFASAPAPIDNAPEKRSKLPVDEE